MKPKTEKPEQTPVNVLSAECDIVSKQSVTLKGIIGSKGACLARAYVYRRRIEVKKTFLEPEQLDAEKVRLEQAMELTRQDILAVQREAEAKHGAKYAAIFESHLLMLTDPGFKPKMVRKLMAERVNVESIVRETIDGIQAAFMAIEDAYLRERAIDIKDVGDRLLRHLMGLEGPAKEIGDEAYVLIAHDVTPSELLAFSRGKLQGICLDSGGATSHVAILAGAIGIPSVFGLANLSQVARTGDQILVDSREEGTVILRPTSTCIAAMQAHQAPRLSPGPFGTVTTDGLQVLLGANVSRLEELSLLQTHQISRIGLFRSEFLFMESFDLPSEKFQEEVYRQVIQAAPDMAVLRTLDIGSDKPVKYLPFPPEENPAMGFRSIRFALSRPDILEPQLRAMVRAAAGSPCRIIFPMVSHERELQQISDLYKKVLDEVSPSQAPEWGIMVEVPSAVFMMEQIARYTSYISLGTNDLLQFFYGIDRTNERLADQGAPLSLAFLRLLFFCVSAAHSENIKIGICGEMASDPAGFLTLLGIGLEEFSMRPAAFPVILRLIPKVSRREVSQFIQGLLTRGIELNIRAEIHKAFPHIAQELDLSS